MNAPCNCRGEILPHPSNPGTGCPPDWETIRLLPRRDMVSDGPWCDPRAAKPLGWDCAACGAFTRDIPLSAGWDAVADDHADHRARCPERNRNTETGGTMTDYRPRVTVENRRAVSSRYADTGHLRAAVAHAGKKNGTYVLGDIGDNGWEPVTVSPVVTWPAYPLHGDRDGTETTL